MITEVVGKEIEKIKGDFESYLNGLNMVGEISYSQYSELYDEGVKQIHRAYELGKSELEKENAELKVYNGKLLNGDIEKHNKIVELNDKLNNLESVAEVRLANWQKYEKENKELKEELTAAKDLLKRWVDDRVYTVSEQKDLITDTEQFLEEE